MGDEQQYGTALRRALRSEWRGRRVTVMGLGQYRYGTGQSSAAFFASLGAKVLVTDRLSSEHFRSARVALRSYTNIRYRFGEHRIADFEQTDLVIKNPIIPATSEYLQAARARGIPVETDVSWFIGRCPSRVIGVTGTRGKSTTATLIAHLLGGEASNVWLGGNIGRSPLHFFFRLNPDSLVVLELSSWMLESIAPHHWSPSIAVVTNFYRDHLNTYSSFAAYTRAKSLIARFQRRSDICISNGDQPTVQSVLRNMPGKQIRFSLQNKGEATLRGESFVLKRGAKMTRLALRRDLRLPGKHNLANALAALTAAALLELPEQRLRARLRRFQGVPERIETIRILRRRRFVDDTTATSPDATITAVHCFSKPLTLIAGGTDKSLEFSALAHVIAQRTTRVILLPGTATDRLSVKLQKLNVSFFGPVQSMREAVRLAWKGSRPGETILLSPGAASFGLFVNEFDRGKAFRRAVQGLQ